MAPELAAVHHRAVVPDVVDEDTDLFEVEEAAARLTERLARVDPEPARPGPDGRPLLVPPPTRSRDPCRRALPGRVTLVVFGAHATRRRARSAPCSTRSAVGTVGVVWRHYPDRPPTRARRCSRSPSSAAGAGRFWPLTRELLRLRHFDPGDLHGPMIRAGLAPEPTLEAMRAGTGAERIASDVASALASGVTYTPALFVDGTRLRDEAEPGPVLAALDAALHA